MIQNCIEGQVAFVTETGDLVTDISCERIREIRDARQAKIKVGDHETIGIFPADHGEPDGTLIAVEGPTGFLEIGITGMNISDMLGLGPSQSLTISW